MHPEAFTFVRNSLLRLPLRTSVLEYGGRVINGTVRTLFSAPSYLSIDIVPGPGVDKLADAASYKPDLLVDTVVCCEVLEHTQKWPEIVKSASRALKDDGVLLLTCACDPRAPHSSIDGGSVRDFEYYKNVNPLELSSVVEQAGFKQFEIDCDDKRGDLYLIAWKSEC